MAVYLLACATGKGRRRFAQELADILQTVVFAPTEKRWIHREGSFSVHAGTSDDPANGAPKSAGAGEAAKPGGTMKAFYPAPVVRKRA
jgi:hypothetical protein